MNDPARLVGQVLGGSYRLERVIGRGGMGTVYEAQHTRLPRRLAVKLLHAEVGVEPEVAERFKREATIATALGHEHIVEVVDFNVTERGIPFMVLELLEGEDLGARLARLGRLPAPRLLGLLDQACDALAVAHARGVVHRDLKPQNIFLCRRGGRDDFVKLLDFGISKVLRSSSLVTRTGTLMGTPNYMSPEQAEGQRAVDARTDVFALGAIAYEALSGRLAFDGESLVATLYQVCHVDPRPLREVAPDVSPTLARVIERAMARNPDQRWASAAELRAALAEAASAAPAVAVPAGSEADDTQISLPPPAVAQAFAARTVSTMSASAGESLLAAARTAARAGSGRARRVAAAAGAGAIVAIVAALVSRSGPGPAGEEVAGGARPATAAPEPARPDPEPQVVRLTLELSPPGAEVELDGLVRRDNPLVVPRGAARHRLRVTAPGHVPYQSDVAAIADAHLRVRLEPLPTRPAPPAPPAASHRTRRDPRRRASGEGMLLEDEL